MQVHFAVNQRLNPSRKQKEQMRKKCSRWALSTANNLAVYLDPYSGGNVKVRERERGRRKKWKMVELNSCIVDPNVEHSTPAKICLFYVIIERVCTVCRA